jgi:periplasmic protein TonB
MHAPPAVPVAAPPAVPPESPARGEPEEPVIRLPGVAPGATATAAGDGTAGRASGSGAGSGSGASSPAAGRGTGDRPVSVAAIKHRALPRGDYEYFDAGKDYPPDAKRLGIEGDIRVKLVVDEHGRVVSRVLLDHLGHGLDEIALARALAIEFTPALDSDDHPVASVVVWTFHMNKPK